MADLDLASRFDGALTSLPLVAILRGLKPDEAENVGTVLYEAGFRFLEVPLNSPDPFDSIAAMRRLLPPDALVGAGTITEVEQILRLGALGADLAVMPHADTDVIRAAKAQGMVCLPGVLTPTEAFAALRAGADALKLFPAELMPPAIVKALRVVLPRGTRLMPVGGITPETMEPYLAAGASGFGLGSALYAPGMGPNQVAERAARFVAVWKGLHPP